MQSKQDSLLKLTIKRVYGVYSLIVFILVFFLLFPLFLIGILFKNITMGLWLTHYWCIISNALMGIKLVIENKDRISKDTNYIFCPNHFSFFDILTMPALPVPFRFVGKLSLSSIPFFGFYYRKNHITVDRENLKSSYEAYRKSIEALREGYSLTVFPEGGINVVHSYQMSEFKKGPFKMAMETGVSIVPISIIDCWSILPDDGKFWLTRKKNRVVIHEPIDPEAYKASGIEKFQEDVYNIIQTELNQRNS